MKLEQKYSRCHQFLIKDKTSIDFLINQAAANQFGMIAAGNYDNAKENIEPLQNYLSYFLSVGDYSNYHEKPYLIAAYVTGWLEKFSAQKLEVSSLKSGGRDGKLSKLLIKTPGDTSEKTKLESEIGGVLIDNEWDYFTFRFQGEKGTADRQIVLSVDKFQSIRTLINKLLELMVKLKKGVNVFQIVDFQVLFNVNPVRKKLRDEKIIIRYTSGSGGDAFPYFDENGQGIFESLAPLVAETRSSNVVFPFFPFYASLNSWAAWGSYHEKQPFAETRGKAMADMLEAVGEVSREHAHFKEYLEYYFTRHDIDPEAPHLSL